MRASKGFGANKIAVVLAERGVRTSPKYVAELMREMGLQSVSIYSKRDYQKSERLAKKQNMLQRQFKADEPNRVWVSDITCFKVNGKYLYVCVILDLFSRKVVAHRVSPKNSTYLVTSTFRQAYRNRNEPAADVSQRPRPAIYIQHIPETALHEQGCPVFLEVRPSP